MQPLQVKIFSCENSPDKMPHLPHLDNITGVGYPKSIVAEVAGRG